MIYSFGILFLAALPAWMFIRNLAIFHVATADENFMIRAAQERVSVLIPARNEEVSIGAAIDHVMANRSMEFELLILDDQSEDSTAAIVRQRIAMASSTIRLIESKPLPSGWNGKQHACWRLAESAQFDWLLFLDADVRLSEQAIQRIIAEALRSDVALLSGFPHQETGTFAEKLLIPLMHFILLGYLPLRQLRSSTSPSLSAGCGQMMLARRSAYLACDGHRAIQASRHDGIQLPRVFRRHGLSTDIFDATDIAACRMYLNRREVVLGLLKNADEGIANQKLIVIFTVLLAGAAILPIPSLIIACSTQQSLLTITVLAAACFASYVPRAIAVVAFQQSWLAAILHPIGVAWFLTLQWLAFFKSLQGKRVAWRGRA
ncbi:MAG: glycosyltransferase family 2 protein [Pirellulaceae bacterium]|nr:glycosyltransferase family 2 protein [Pirellulaceae bacterium]